MLVVVEKQFCERKQSYLDIKPVSCFVRDGKKQNVPAIIVDRSMEVKIIDGACDTRMVYSPTDKLTLYTTYLKLIFFNLLV